MQKKRKISEDDDDDMFVIQKSKNKKSTKKPGKQLQRLKRNESDDEYQPKMEKESSCSELDPSSEEEQLTNKKKRNTKTTSTNQKQPRKTQKKEKQESQMKDEDQFAEPQDNCIQRDAEEFFKLSESLLPTFMQPDFIRDADGNKPDSPNYDPSTISIPIGQYQKLSPMFRQYWNAKRNHFDSIIFFRCGRWITVMYSDAILIAKLFNRHLGFWGKDRPCLTVYDSQLPIYERTLLDKGYKIMLVEQMEKADIANKEDGEIVRREITSIISRGTLQDLADNDTYEARHLIVLVCTNAPVNLKGNKYIYGLSIVDCTTNNFYLDQFQDDEQSNQLRSVIYKIRPAEAIYLKVPEEVQKMIKNICNPTVIISNREFQECDYIFEQIKHEYQEEKQQVKQKGKQRKNSHSGSIDFEVPSHYIEPEVKPETDINQGLYSDKKEGKILEESQNEIELTLSVDYPNLLQELEKQFYHEKKNSQDQEESYYFTYYYSVQAFYIQLCYLRKLLISTTVYRRGRFSFLDSCFSQKRNLYLDSQALESLEIFEVNLQTKVTNKGSLFDYLDKCATPYGKRLLTKWVQSPLLDCKEIIERQESIQDLMNNIEPSEEFQKRLRSLPDLERAIIRCFNTIHSHKLKAVPVTGGESYGRIKLKEIASVIKNIKASSEAFKVFDKYLPKFKSVKLKKMVNSQDIAKSLTNIFKDLEKCLIIKDGEPQPVQGVSPEYDTALEKLTIITDKLDEELNKWKQVLKCPDIVYHHGKIKYQLEIPDKYIDGIKKPKELVITSKKKGYQRFQTEIIEQQIYKLKVVEDELSSKLLPFINEYFTKFYSYRKELLQLISSLSTLDSLISLALVSKNQNISCFPQIIELDPDEEIDSQFNLQEGFHPCLLQNREIEWISNSIKFSNQIDTLLLTGPNMSGKSTLLRLIGVSIILAQIGCAVPAKSFQLIPFDRIFCRLGASDRLLEGKSTFFIELEETKTILENCTNRSLVIIDELGRGTSTYDGVALASAVLRYLSQKIRPKTLFATHYHILLDEFALFKNIQQCVMKHYQQGDKVIFEYKLINGAAQKSFAANVAKIAGIPNEVVQRAKEMEEKITKEESKINKNRDILKKFNKIVENLF